MKFMSVTMSLSISLAEQADSYVSLNGRQGFRAVKHLSHITHETTMQRYHCQTMSGLKKSANFVDSLQL
ncbi:hypothetical protein CLV58_13520 [Spirosoma oryzae]|uniref:Uncharacterized protein n=1 Tax=Spirosoma oryzae TaxID=1469603 RepID=A0A2T0S0R2_9BACT|nr:hypothetical protein CLV58_13520 [Spirosoma oryzae]